jgi:hypothetical protein
MWWPQVLFAFTKFVPEMLKFGMDIFLCCTSQK